MELLIVVLVVAAVALVIAAPLRRARAAPDGDTTRGEVDELEVARDAKYREIRDAELDYRTGKLSEADWRAPRRRPAGRGDRDPARARPGGGPERCRVVP